MCNISPTSFFLLGVRMSPDHVLTTADSTRGIHQLQKLNYHLCNQSAASDLDKNVQTCLKK